MPARSDQWPGIRAKHLVEEPKCQACGGVKDLEVHHIAPFHLHPDLELEDSNLITLCEWPGHSCHFVFGHFHDWYDFNPTVRADAAAYYARQQEARKGVVE